jgi:hypothetical protein
MQAHTRALLQDDMAHARILYLMNMNGIRNTMLDFGRAAGAEWIMPFDGNTFFTTKGWDALRSEVLQTAAAAAPPRYYAVPMARVVDNKYLLNPDFWPEATVCIASPFHGRVVPRA